MILSLQCCHKPIGDKEHIFCDLYKLRVRIKYNNLNYVGYEQLSGCSDPWYCLSCNSEIHALDNLNKQNIISLIREKLTDSLKLDKINSKNTLVLKLPANLRQLFNQFNNGTGNYRSRDPDNAVKCRYYIKEEIQTLNIPKKEVLIYVSH